MSLTVKDLEELGRAKAKILKQFFEAEPPKDRGEDLIDLWNQIYDDALKSTVIQTASGPSDDNTNPVFPYEKLYAIVGDGGNWKWPRAWECLDQLQRRGPAYREGDALNLDMPNPNPHVVPQRVVVVGGGPVGLRLAIELKLGGHHVTVFEKRRETRSSEDHELTQLGFTNRINRPHVFNFLRNDLERLNGRNWMSSKMCYPIFTQGDTASIGIDELQLLLLKSALLLGVDFRLGVSFDDAEMQVDPKSQKPRWKVKCTYDLAAASTYKVDPGSRDEVFDVVMGCDGARSRVRESQPQIFGEVDKRNFKKMIGVVGNVQKVSRQRLKDLGFPSGQEPTDMKRAHSGGGGMAGVNYYKASYHNYVIFTPSKEDLQQAGIGSTGIYTFHGGRAENPTRDEEKLRLKVWVVQRCKELGIPIDETLSNGGFVEAPNDVMAFDFSEIWKCKKNFAVNIPSLDYDVEAQGTWTGRELIAPIGLVGDAVTEPFWISGVGLQRGWNGIMDACYLIDNLYNLTFSGEIDPIEPTSWEDHMSRIQAVLPTLYEYSHDGRMTKEGLQGEYSDQGVVMTQLNRQLKDAEKPKWHLQIEPSTRYEPLSKALENKYKGAKAIENQHPVVVRQLKTLRMGKSSDGMNIYQAKTLISVSGRTVPSANAENHIQQQNSRVQEVAAAAAAPAPSPPPIPQDEIEKVATAKTEGLHTMLAKQLEKKISENRSTAASRSSPFDDERWKELPQEEASGFAEIAERQWDVMTEKHLSPAQKAELQHIRNMKASLQQQIVMLQSSCKAFERAEMELLLTSNP